MNRLVVTVSLAVVLAGSAVGGALAQNTSSLLLTAHGDPDIQGLFTFRTLTPVSYTHLTLPTILLV